MKPTQPFHPSRHRFVLEEREGCVHPTGFELCVIISHRAHLNDIENIVPFLGIGLLYSLSGPDLSTALLHFRIFVGARIYHTIAYLTPLPQPNRALAFFGGFGVTLSMAYSLLRNRLYL